MRVNNQVIKYFLNILQSADPDAIHRLSKEEQKLVDQICDAYDVTEFRVSEKALTRLQLKILHPEINQKNQKNQKLIEKINRVCSKAKIIKISPEFIQIIHDLPETKGDQFPVIQDVTDEQIEQLAKVGTTETEPVSDVSGSNTFEKVLSELDRLKDRLGGAPNYNGQRPPATDDKDKNKTFLGTPLPAVKDWLRNTIKEGRRPRAFWKIFAAKLFGIRKDNQETQYEYAAKAIQRFGLVISNKELFLNIVRENNREDFPLFGQLTGLAWHPDRNAAAVEEESMHAIELFFTEYFEKAKVQGDDALVDFFNALTGVCFEVRAENIRQYILSHSHELKAAREVADYDTFTPLNEMLTKETQLIFDLSGEIPGPKALYEHLLERGVFGTEFGPKEAKEKLDLEAFHKWVLKQQADFILDYYTQEDFLLTEYEILRSSKKEINRNEFINQLNERLKECGEIDLYDTDDKENEISFEVNAEKIGRWIDQQRGH